MQLDPGNKDAVVPREAKPFGRAFYMGKAEYCLAPWWMMPLITTALMALRTAYGILPIAISWYLLSWLTWDVTHEKWEDLPEWSYLLLLNGVYVWVHMAHVMLRTSADHAVKWILIGKAVQVDIMLTLC